ncbi:PGR5-like protein 1B, chloroplastic isoform X2 [Neltuma alba]|uniref:PGR5-like protein 1B, chloroplastic isoform X2 n=1 Tax=Neltuma alba TaxID=207710 RepID=UPI0010A5346E|nr:PGR5-like protein 1B, chloroplastic isoform X2 [Prosopis alba]
MSYRVLYLKLFRSQGGASRRLMAATSPSFSPQRSTLLEFPRSSRSLPSFSVRFSAKSNGASVSPTCDNLAQGPHCVYVGPIESASQETLEALYLQARDAYYSGRPLIVDDMFDRVELKLRWYGSKSVVKYPRCSIRRQSTYADAEADLSMIFALASTWIVFLAFGSTICVGPVLYTISMAYYTAFNSGLSYVNQGSGLGFLATVNSVVFMTLGCVIGYPVASASAKVLQGLWRNDLVALKGACPNCGEEVFAFVRRDRANDSPHRADCHVCGCLLEFQTQVEQSVSRLGRKWVYGRIYLVSLRGRSQRQRRL